MTDWKGRALSADDAVWIVQSGMNVFVHGAAATPTPLLEALARRSDLRNVNLYHMHTAGPAPFADADQQGRFFSVSLFTGAPLRKAIEEGRADFVPIFLSDIPGLFANGHIKLDVAIAPVVPAGLRTGTARWAPLSIRRWRPPVGTLSSLLKSTSRCRARTGTPWSTRPGEHVDPHGSPAACARSHGADTGRGGNRRSTPRT